jgi:hypothetical protein
MDKPPEEIAAGLSAGEREALLRCIPGKYYGTSYGGWPGSAFDPASFCRAGRRLMDMRLIAWHPDRKDSRTLITPLGVSVRAALQSKVRHD